VARVVDEGPAALVATMLLLVLFGQRGWLIDQRYRYSRRSRWARRVARSRCWPGCAGHHRRGAGRGSWCCWRRLVFRGRRRGPEGRASCR
jgi:hypothetical protein